MGNFLLMTSGGVMPETEEAQAAIMKAWSDWFEVLGEHLVNGPNMTGPVVKTIMNDGFVKDGAGDGTMATGYLIIKAESFDDALQLAMGRPLDGGNVTLYEILSSM
jgi:hypothetical protein